MLRICDLEKPRPAADDIFVRIHCSGVNRTDVGLLRSRPFITRLFSGLNRPRPTALGCEFAGEIDDVGWGGHAEYKVIAQDRSVATNPDGITDERAAASTECAHYVLVGVRAAKVAEGDRVLVHGATGAIVSAAVQLYKHAGICARDRHPRNVELVDSLGADEVVDRVCPLAEMIDAFEYVETGQKTGNVVIGVTEAGRG